jgi:hypothetical protein
VGAQSLNQIQSDGVVRIAASSHRVNRAGDKLVPNVAEFLSRELIFHAQKRRFEGCFHDRINRRNSGMWQERDLVVKTRRRERNRQS